MPVMDRNYRRMPVVLKGATRFIGEPQLADELWAVRELKRHQRWLDKLLTDTDLERNWGRPRLPGHWALAYLAFVGSRQVDIEPWWAMSSAGVWLECGFSAKPSYQAVWKRFAELEQATGAFHEAATLVIRRAVRKSDGKVGRAIHIDATEAESNAVLAHDCRDGEACARQARRRARGLPLRVGRLHADDERARRHARHGKEVEAEDAATAEAMRDVVYDSERGVLRMRRGGCWYRTRDATAGYRICMQGAHIKKGWFGFLDHKVIDHYTGGTLLHKFEKATVQDYHTYPELLDGVIETLGRTPVAMMADRGLATRSVYELTTRKGIATVIPSRGRRATDQDSYDRHGIPRCRHCGGETHFVRFNHQPTPRLWVRCLIPSQPGCQREQTISCSTDWKRLLPLWRTEPAYAAYRQAHQTYERVHHHQRQRYKVAGDTHAIRPKRIGVGCQQLRANAAGLIEWLRICHREGWLGCPRTNRDDEFVRPTPGYLRYFLAKRLQNDLHLPQGPVAERLRAEGKLPPNGGPPPPDREQDPPGYHGPPPADPTEVPF